MRRSSLVILGFMPHFIKIVVREKATEAPHHKTVVVNKQGHSPKIILSLQQIHFFASDELHGDQKTIR